MVNRNPRTTDREVYERERELVRENQTIRDNDSAATGLIVGILLAGLTALGIAAYFLSQRPNTPAPSRTIIERTKEIVPQPQQPAPQAPDVNVTVPNPEPPRVNITVPSPAAPSNTAPESQTSPNQPAASPADPGQAPANP